MSGWGIFFIIIIITCFVYFLLFDAFWEDTFSPSLHMLPETYLAVIEYRIEQQGVSAGRGCKFTLNGCFSDGENWGRVLRRKSSCAGGNFPYSAAGKTHVFFSHCMQSLEILVFVMTLSRSCTIFEFH